jgi:hypothetical protein
MIYYSNHKYCRTELILGIYQVVLMDDPTRSFTSFSQDFGLGYYEEGRCRSWAGRHMGGLNAITAEAINPKVNHGKRLRGNALWDKLFKFWRNEYENSR